MAYAIMRCKKHTTMGTIAAALQHNYRERETLNADADRTEMNQHAMSTSSSEALGRLRELLPATDRRGQKVRKDAVRCVEYMMTTSPEWMAQASEDQIREFFKEAGTWLKEKYGRENTIAFSAHLDETTPHISAFVVPIDREGFLNAKSFIGGKDKLSRDQTTFAERVKHLGLERGIEGSKAKHQTIQQFYRQTNKPTPQVEIPTERRVVKKGLLKDEYESDREFAERVGQAVKEQFKPYVAKAATAEQEKRSKRDYEKTAKNLVKSKEAAHRRLQEHLEPFQGLSKDQMDQILAEARQMTRQNQIRRDRDRGDRGGLER